jgi:UDP-N-acetylmuramoyl-tripeptide--D-alanyl-D-alanine ligase
LPGRLNISNALAAAAAAHALGLGIEAIAAGLQRVEPVTGRLNVTVLGNGATLIDDTYNANPASVDAALAVLVERPGRHILVLGDLAELGPDADTIHREIGTKARQLGIDALYSNGPASRLSSEAFGTGGQHFDSTEDLASALWAKLDANTSVLVKGSRSAAMERVANELTKKRTEHPFSPKKDAPSFSSQGVEG